MKCASICTLRWIIASASRADSGSSLLRPSSCTAIITGVSGVRSSCESTARKWSLVLLAASASRAGFFGFLQGGPKVLAALLQRLARLAGLRFVPQDFDEPNQFAPGIVHPHQRAVRPETAAVLALVPPLVGGASRP